jgi:hypothetical protein
MANAPLPFNDPIVHWRDQRGREQKAGLTNTWEKSLSDMTDRIGMSSAIVANVSLSEQSAAISATNIPVSSLTTGLYRVNYYARITQAATTSSSLTVTIQWTDGGVSCNYVGAAMTGNTTATFQSASVLVLATQGTPIRYSTAYTSVGATSMEYKLLIACQAVSV